MATFDYLASTVQYKYSLTEKEAIQALRNGRVTVNKKAVGVSDVGTSLNSGDELRLDGQGPLIYSKDRFYEPRPADQEGFYLVDAPIGQWSSGSQVLHADMATEERVAKYLEDGYTLTGPYYSKES